MDDQGFDFRNSPDRREPKRFEPPPWERDAFEEFQRQRAAAAAEEQVARSEEVVPAAAVTENAVPQPSEAEGVATESTATAETEAAASPKGPSEAEVERLLAGLAAEEPKASAPATQVTIGSAIVLAPIGIMMVFWGMAAFARASSAQSGAGLANVGAMVLIMFGTGFVGAAVYLVYRLLKQRGDI